MEWQVIDLQNLAIIDQEIGDYRHSASQYEILRRVVYSTADLEYQSLLRFSERALQIGAAALASRTPIITDVPLVKVGILPYLQETFVNAVYCGAETPSPPRKDIPPSLWGFKTLADRYPEGIFIIGQQVNALTLLLELIQNDEVRPSFLIATPPSFLGIETVKKKLKEFSFPYVYISGRKGSPVVATAILNGLVELAWQGYEMNKNIS
jgi:precorrin-8X/cobalt-precorrin-8 methylmutase